MSLPLCVTILLYSIPLLAQTQPFYVYSQTNAKGQLTYFRSRNPPSMMVTKGYKLIGTVGTSPNHNSHATTHTAIHKSSAHTPNNTTIKPSILIEGVLKYFEKTAAQTGFPQKLSKELNNVQTWTPGDETPFDHLPRSFDYMMKRLKEATYTLIDMDFKKTPPPIPPSRQNETK